MFKRKIWFFCGLLAAGLMIITLGSACKAKKQEAAKSTETLVISEDMLTPILGQGAGSSSGLLDANYGENVLTVSYYLFIEDMSRFDEQLGTDLAPKIRQLYEKFSNIDQTRFTVHVPAVVGSPMKPHVSFSLTRRIMDETDWTNLLNTEFLRVVADVKYYD